VLLWPVFAVRSGELETSPKTIYVDVRNVGDPSQDGSVAHPFGTIQEGIDAAGSGDTVQVAAGEYHESVQIVKSSVSLVGQKGGTVIDGNGTMPVGIRLYHTPPNYTENVSISGFTVRNCVKGITLSRSIYTRLRDNSMVGNTYNFGDYTLQVQDIDASNTVDGKPIYFWNYQHDRQVPADAGFVAIVDSQNITVRDLDLANNVQGLILKNTTDSLIENVRIHDNWDGLYLERWSNSNTIIHSSMSRNLFMGVYVSTSSSNLIANNSMLNNAYGILLDSSVFEYTEGFSPTGNTVEDNIITQNTVAGSSLNGVYLIGCVDNVFFDNNFDNNKRQVESLNSTNIWNDGTEGNLWSDYAGKDLDHDGIGDSPYVIDENNRDNHPLTGFLSDFPATWQNETYSVVTVSDSVISTFAFSQPDKMISFNINGSDSVFGFCRVSIPVNLIGGQYTFLLDGVSSTEFVSTSNETHSFLYFTYNGAHNVKILGTSVVSEFPSFLLVLLLAGLTAGAVAVKLTWKKPPPALSG
jgi:nitrous oxidase accessory protein NosD